MPPRSGSGMNGILATFLLALQWFDPEGLYDHGWARVGNELHRAFEPLHASGRRPFHEGRPRRNPGGIQQEVHGDAAYDMPPLRVIQDSGIVWGLGSDGSRANQVLP
ncbi:MAG: hypothetical protein ACRD3V_02535, partial [Vicinamibacteria bacterium]